MARLSTAGGASYNPPDYTHINLTRMISRLQSTIINPDEDTKWRLRVSALEREKVGKNLEYAASLLLKLEQEAQQIRILSKKQEVQTDLVRKRETLGRLRERLGDWADAGDVDDDEEEEDLVGEDTPSEEGGQEEEEDVEVVEEEYIPPIPHFNPQPSEPTIRHRIPTAQESHDALLASSKSQESRDALFTSSSSHRRSLSTKESLLTHNRAEQEALTSSLLSLASKLKESSRAFAKDLDDEKDVLEGASRGIDKSESGLHSAGKKMGMLRGMTEGRGWWGRMLMYAWIAGLAVVALVVVFVLPKFRF